MATVLSRVLLDSRRIISDLRIIDPQRFRIDPLPAGTATDQIQLNPEQVQALLRAAALDVADAESDSAQGRVLWRHAGSELLVVPGRLQVRLSEGLLAISLPVQCDQTGDAMVHVSFAIGSARRPAGLVATTEERPRGPDVVVDLWGERVVAYLWRSLLELLESLAAESGRDEDGAPLLPAAMQASANGLTVQAMARHAFDRVTKR